MVDLEKEIYFFQFYFILCKLGPFHREWPQLAAILMSFELSFGTKSKSLTFELKQVIHGGNRIFFFKKIHPWIWLPE